MDIRMFFIPPVLNVLKAGFNIRLINVVYEDRVVFKWNHSGSSYILLAIDSEGARVEIYPVLERMNHSLSEEIDVVFRQMGFEICRR